MKITLKLEWEDSDASPVFIDHASCRLRNFWRIDTDDEAAFAARNRVMINRKDFTIADVVAVANWLDALAERASIALRTRGHPDVMIESIEQAAENARNEAERLRAMIPRSAEIIEATVIDNAISALKSFTDGESCDHSVNVCLCPAFGALADLEALKQKLDSMAQK